MAETGTRAKWVLERPLGGGAQGNTYLVYRGDDPAKTLHVLKELKLTRSRDPQLARARFAQEVSAVESMMAAGCPNIISVVDRGSTDEPPWFVMPFFAAGAMWQAKRSPPYLEPYKGNVTRVLEIAAELARSLAVIHRAGAVHRDVKCGNVFFEQVGGPPVLGDFGLIYLPDSENDPETATGERLGPGRWRPPELRRGGRTSHHPASDVYMLGGMIYEALTGGDSLDETEHTDGSFTHEAAGFALDRCVNDARLPHINVLLRNLLRRDPDLRMPSAQVERVIPEIQRWAPNTPPPPATILGSRAEAAAAEFRQRSKSIREERIRADMAIVCERVASHFNERSWAAKNQLTVMIDVNRGDDGPFTHVQREYPGYVWLAIRVLAALETNTERPMLMSYVMLGRGKDELVALFSARQTFALLSQGPLGTPSHEQLLLDTTARQRAQLLEDIVPLIERLP